MQNLITKTCNRALIQEPKLKKNPPSQQKLQARKWSQKEVNILVCIFSDPLNKMSIKDIAQLLNRSPKAVEIKKDKMKIGSSRCHKKNPLPHLNYPERKPGASLELIPAFKANIGTPHQTFLPFLKGEPSQKSTSPQENLPAPQSNPLWSPWDSQCLTHYWGLRALGVNDIAIFLRKTTKEILEKAKQEGLPEKPLETPTNKYRISRNWEIEKDIVISELSNDEQHALAELTATRLSHLKNNPHETSGGEKEANKEINHLFEVQRHIFHKAIRSKAKKLSQLFNDSVNKENDLIQIGESALYQVISRWDPSKGINFCRATVAQNIERQMQHWIRKCRVVQLPTGLISEIVEERRKVNGEPKKSSTIPKKRKTPQRKDSIQRYLYSVHPDRAIVPLNESHEENDDSRFEQFIAGQEGNQRKTNTIQAEHQSYAEPEIEKKDIKEIVANICKDIPETERYAFCQYHGIGEEGEEIPNKNLRELAAECNVSAERIRQRINLAKEKMIKKLSKAGIHCSTDAF